MIPDGMERISGYAHVALRSYSEKSARTYFPDTIPTDISDAYEA